MGSYIGRSPDNELFQKSIVRYDGDGATKDFGLGLAVNDGNDLVVGDKNALMVGTRILGYGKDYDVVIIDPKSGERVETTIDKVATKHNVSTDIMYNYINKETGV